MLIIGEAIMSDLYANSRSTTDTAVRKKDVNPTSGMCPICIHDCKVLCEVGKSALRGREVLYPDTESFGHSTASSNKDYGLDWSDFQILTDVIGARGIEASPDKATFPNVDIKTKVGGIPLSVPVFTAGLGSTAVAKNYWNGLAVGAAISGSIQVIGENICGMDMESTFTGGKVTKSPELKWRVDTFREFWDGKNGEIVVQTNVEDQRLGTDVYALSKLEVNVIERKWGQGAKAIGGEVRIYDLKKALELKKRGYVVLPDPEDPSVQKAFKDGAFKTFERHSRVGFPNFKGFVEDIEWLRDQGSKKVFLKTGAYRPAATAFTLKCASAAKIDLLTFDGAGGGTGMSPVPMMNDCSTPDGVPAGAGHGLCEDDEGERHVRPRHRLRGRLRERDADLQVHGHVRPGQRPDGQGNRDGTRPDHGSHEGGLLRLAVEEGRPAGSLCEDLHLGPGQVHDRLRRSREEIRQGGQEDPRRRHRPVHLLARPHRRGPPAAHGGRPQVEPRTASPGAT